MELGLSLPESAGLQPRNWLRELDANQAPTTVTKAEVKVLEFLKGARKKCKSGVTFECNCCTETGASFKILGTPLFIQTFNPVLQICHGLCHRGSRAQVIVDLAHEMLHYAGADDSEKETRFNPNDFSAHLGAMAEEYDKYAKDHPDDPVVKAKF